MISAQRNVNILPQYLGEQKTEQDEFQQEEEEWQMPDKWQRISQTVFCGRCLGINPNVGEAQCISSSCTQHLGGGCSACES